MPGAFTGNSLTVDGQTLEIVEAEGLANRDYPGAPSLKAVFDASAASCADETLTAGRKALPAM